MFARVAEAAARGSGDRVVTLLREGLQIVPIEEQCRVAVVGLAVVHHGGGTEASAFTERVLGEIGEAQLLPAPAVDARWRGTRGDVVRLALLPRLDTDRLMLRGSNWHAGEAWLRGDAATPLPR